MIRALLLVTLGTVVCSEIAAQSHETRKASSGERSADDLARRMYFGQMLGVEIDRLVAEARKKMREEPAAAFADLKFAYENVKRSPELDSADRQRLMAKLIEAGREAKQMERKERPTSDGVSEARNIQAVNTANDLSKSPARKSIRDVLGPLAGRGVEIEYPYRYDGIFVQGTSTFIFTVDPQRVSDDGDLVLVRLRNIRRLWNGQLQESDISAMPFTDPRGYKVYDAPANWGDTAAIGDTAWFDVGTLRRGESDAGTIVDTGKADQMMELAAVGVAAGVAIHEVTKGSESPSEREGPMEIESEDAESDYLEVYLPEALVCNRGFVRKWMGRVDSTEDGSTYKVRITYSRVPEYKVGSTQDIASYDMKLGRFRSLDDMYHGAGRK